ALGTVSSASRTTLPAVLPLSRRLESVFCARVEELPGTTRHLLLLAVLDGTGDLAVLESVDDRVVKLEDLSPAEHARLVAVDRQTGRLTFQHPLIRAAIVAVATKDELRAAHRFLARQREGDRGRQAWHLAEAAIGPDEQIAELLADVARATLRRGDATGAVIQLLRSADLSPAVGDRSSRLAEAAYIGATVLGDLREVLKRLEAVRHATPERSGRLEMVLADAYSLIIGAGDVNSAHRMLVRAIDELETPDDAHSRPLIEALYVLLLSCFYSGRVECWESVHIAVDRLRPTPPRLLAILRETRGDAARVSRSVLDRLDEAVASLDSETSPVRIVRVGVAASYVDRLSDCRAALTRVAQDGRDGGAITSAIEAMFLLGNDGFWSGDWDESSRLCAEALDLCAANGYGLVAPGRLYTSLIAAAQGEFEGALAGAAEMESWAAPRQVEAVRFFACHVRALAALGRGDFETAYQNAAAISAAGEFASHVPHALWVIWELVESATRTGRTAEATRHVAAIEAAGIATISARLAMIAGAAAALCAPDGEAQARYEAALGLPHVARWPFDEARIRLSFGERLRRMKATGQARRQLSAALGTFERLGSRPWADRARTELRATGLAVGRSEPNGVASLTPQQHEIAILAAAGLTNKQIGERLFLSPRTVSTHLHQLFPKLAITSRAELRDVLDDSPTEQ
ncbi:MAG: LuxR family transcriptional regulator, partial [Ilumatobacteraceae bacterium]|nr:LuxR family transcriptional regulator [Ilumatobacteraceae bacterium]